MWRASATRSSCGIFAATSAGAPLRNVGPEPKAARPFAPSGRPLWWRQKANPGLGRLLGRLRDLAPPGARLLAAARELVVLADRQGPPGRQLMRERRDLREQVQELEAALRLGGSRFDPLQVWFQNRQALGQQKGRWSRPLPDRPAPRRAGRSRPAARTARAR